MLRVALMDDHPLMLKVIAQELAQALDIKLMWKTTKASELMERVKQLAPDVLVLDLGFGQQPFEPVNAVRDLRATHPHTAILILTTYDDPVWVDELMRAGAGGYILKSDDFSLRLPDAIRTVAQGRPFLSPGAAQALGEARRKYTLTPRERAILRLAASGKANGEIAQALGLADGTVRNHISNIYAKLGVETREAAIQTAQQLRELPKPDAHIRHELRTPLHSLLGLARLLEGRLARNGQINGNDAELLQQIVAEAERLDHLIGDLDL